MECLQSRWVLYALFIIKLISAVRVLFMRQREEEWINWGFHLSCWLIQQCTLRHGEKVKWHIWPLMPPHICWFFWSRHDGKPGVELFPSSSWNIYRSLYPTFRIQPQNTTVSAYLAIFKAWKHGSHAKKIQFMSLKLWMLIYEFLLHTALSEPAFVFKINVTVAKQNFHSLHDLNVIDLSVWFMKLK